MLIIVAALRYISVYLPNWNVSVIFSKMPPTSGASSSQWPHLRRRVSRQRVLLPPRSDSEKKKTKKKRVSSREPARRGGRVEDIFFVCFYHGGKNGHWNEDFHSDVLGRPSWPRLLSQDTSGECPGVPRPSESPTLLLPPLSLHFCLYTRPPSSTL